MPGLAVIAAVINDRKILFTKREDFEVWFLLGWLRETIYRHGSKFTAPETIKRASGIQFTIVPNINYRKTKYGPLHTL